MAEPKQSFQRPASADTAVEGSGTVQVTTTSAELVPANPDRASLTITNNAPTNTAGSAMYLGLGETAVVNSGIRLSGSTGENRHTIDYFTGAVHILVASGERTALWVET